MSPQLPPPPPLKSHEPPAPQRRFLCEPCPPRSPPREHVVVHDGRQPAYLLARTLVCCELGWHFQSCKFKSGGLPQFQGLLLCSISSVCVAWVHNAPCLLLSEELLLGLNVCALGRVSTEDTCRSARASAERRYRRAPLRGAIHIVITKFL